MQQVQGEIDMQVDLVKEAIVRLKVLESGDSDRINAIGNTNWGICSHLKGLLPHGFLYDCFASWEHYTGDVLCPVPHIDGDRYYDDESEQYVPITSAQGAYKYLDGSKYSGEYGELRRDLARHIREKLEEWLEEHDDER
jgi:hypothetical protein